MLCHVESSGGCRNETLQGDNSDLLYSLISSLLGGGQSHAQRANFCTFKAADIGSGVRVEASGLTT